MQEKYFSGGYSLSTDGYFYENIPGINCLAKIFSIGAELETQLLLSNALRYVSDSDFAKISMLLNEVMRMLNVMIKNLKNPKP